MNDKPIELKKENLPKKNYGEFILRGSLAVECLEDLAGIEPDKEETVDIMFENISKLRKLKKQLAIEEEKVVNEIIDVIHMLGAENFDFYDDGYIEYIGDWQKEKNS